MHPASWWHLAPWWHSVPWPAYMDRSHASSFLVALSSMVALSSLACMYGQVSCIQLHGGTHLPGLQVWTAISPSSAPKQVLARLTLNCSTLFTHWLPSFIYTLGPLIILFSPKRRDTHLTSLAVIETWTF